MDILKDYNVRPIEEKDLELILKWRNSPRVHNMMLTEHIITSEEHRAWFFRNNHNNPSRNLIFEYQGETIGYIGYTEYDTEKNSCSPSIYLGDNDKMPPNAGIQLCITSIIYAFDVLKVDALRTEVLQDNKVSYNLSTLLGYSCVGYSFVIKNEKKISTCILELKKSDREKNRWLKKYEF